MGRLSVGIVFGGRSEEHPISIKSAQRVATSLDPERYEAHFVGITDQGAWRLCDGPTTTLTDTTGCPVLLAPDPTVHGLIVGSGDHRTTVHLDVVLPVLHGRYGEDGAIQGLCELSGVPYVGCDIQSSALCMDKSLAYAVAGRAGVATPDFRVVTGPGPADPAGLPYPVFVKPARSGSSFGVSKVSGPDELEEAVDLARRYDPKVLIEAAVTGREVGCAILGEGTDLLAGAVDEIALSHGFFRIHQEDTPERGSDNSTVIVPADLSPEEHLLVRETAKRVYGALGCRGLARVDLFLTGDGTVVLNEVNTLPGLTAYSRYPRMMAAAGLPLTEVINRVIALAVSGDRR